MQDYAVFCSALCFAIEQLKIKLTSILSDAIQLQLDDSHHETHLCNEYFPLN